MALPCSPCSMYEDPVAFEWFAISNAGNNIPSPCMLYVMISLGSGLRF